MKLITLGIKYEEEKYNKIKNYESYDLTLNKPNFETGLWTSPLEIMDGCVSEWDIVCRDECIRDYDPNDICTIFELVQDSKILKINSSEDYINIPYRFKIKLDWYATDRYVLNFEEITKEYDAIHLTSKGQWETRLNRSSSMYGWDCETVLILNPKCIETSSIEYIKYREILAKYDTPEENN